jgi:ABC-type nitrate/sulfonate/bicarbonate transport system permease component
VKRALPMLLGVLLLAAVWELIGRLGLFGTLWPALSTVIAYCAQPEHQAVLAPAVVRTGSEAVAGLFAGALIAIVLAAAAVLVPVLAAGLGAFASIVNGIPIIAVAGVCMLTLPRDATPAVVAALAAAFIVFVAATAAFGIASAAHRDLFTVLGASRLTTFARLDLPAAIPALLDGLRSAAPAAVVGAIVGEWFASETGLGPMLVASMQNYAIAQLWAIALAATLLSIALYSLLGALRNAALAQLA